MSLQSGGDEDAFFRGVEAHFRPRLRGLFSRKGWKPEVCDDLIQETFLGVVKGLGSLRNENAFTNWIFTIARNVERQHRNKTRGFPNKPSVDIGEDEVEIIDLCPSPEDSAIWREELRRVNSRILKFPPMRKRIFLLKYFHGRENSEIAAVLGCTEGTVRVQLYLARKQLGGFLGRNGKGDQK